VRERSAESLAACDLGQGGVIALRQERSDRCVNVGVDCGGMPRVRQVEYGLLGRGHQAFPEVGTHEFDVEEIQVPLPKIDDGIAVAQPHPLASTWRSHECGGERPWKRSVHACGAQAHEGKAALPELGSRDTGGRTFEGWQPGPSGPILRNGREEAVSEAVHDTTLLQPGKLCSGVSVSGHVARAHRAQGRARQFNGYARCPWHRRNLLRKSYPVTVRLPPETLNAASYDDQPDRAGGC
jgi:hypothetical protein